MFELQYRTPEIKDASKDATSLVLVADLTKPHQLFQGQSVKVKTGVAIKSDQHVFAVPLPELNRIGLVMGSGVELLDTEAGGEIEVLLWNRNQQGQQRMIEILPKMPIAQLTVMPRYCDTSDETNVKAPEEKIPTAASKATPGKRGPKPKQKPAAEAESKTGTDG